MAALAAAAVVFAVGARVRPRPSARCPRREDAIAAATGGSTTTDRPLARVARWQPRHRHVEVTAAEVAVWCEALARAARSGSTLIEAIRDVDPPASCRDAIDAVSLALARGRSMSAALDAVRSPSPHLTLALGVLQACAHHGGRPAEPLDRAAATLRARAMAAAERRTQSAQARLSAVVMTVLPLAMLGLLLVTSSTTRQAATTPLGLLVIATGAVLNLAGWRWMRRIIVGRPT